MFVQVAFSLAISVVPLSSVAAADEAIKKETQKIQGKWQVTAMEIDGTPKSDAEVAKMQMTIAGDRFTLTGLNDDIKGLYTIVEVKGKTRKADLRQAPDKDPELLTIAEWIDDDSFRTCLGSGERPTRFAWKGEGAGIALIVFKRIKK